MVYKSIIIGSGPAGLTAGIYLSRAKISTLVIEGLQPGGQLTTTTRVENWPGNVSILGPELMEKMREQAQVCGAQFKQNIVTAVDLSVEPFTITLEGGEKVQGESLIIATGSSNKKLGCLGEDEYFGRGVATCATCDAPFYNDKEVVIVGGGNTAVTEAEHLTHFAKKVTIIHILDQLTANDPIKDKVIANPKVSFMFNSTVTAVQGNGENVTGVVVQDQKTKQEQVVKTDGVFVAVGFRPNTQLFEGQLDIDQYGYLIKKGMSETSKPGVFAAGDVVDFKYRQAVVSAGAGCMAALDCQTYLGNKNLGK